MIPRPVNAYHVALLAVAIAYAFAETRFPALNLDDTYLLGHHFPAITKGNTLPLITFSGW